MPNRRIFVAMLMLLLNSYSLAVVAQRVVEPPLGLTPSEEVAAVGYFAPKVENGQIVGILSNRPGVLLKSLGIQSGDIILELNGEAFTGPGAISRFVLVLTQASSFDMVVRSSDGAVRTIHCAKRVTSTCSGP